MRLAALVLALLGASCTAPMRPQPNSPVVEAPRPLPLPLLPGTIWRIAELDGAPPPTAHATVRFNAGSFIAGFGCNGLDAAYRIEAGRLLTTMARSAERGCVTPEGQPSPVMDFEDRGFRLLTSGPVIEVLEPTRIRLTSPRGAMLLVAAPEYRLAGTSWKGVTINGGADADAITLTFNVASLDGNLGCNRVVGHYRLGPQALTTEMLAITERGCGDKAMMEREAQAYSVLTRPMQIEQQGDRLMLSNARGRIELSRNY